MKTMLNIKIDNKLKEKAQKVAKELGLPLSVVLNNYLKEFVREKRVVFGASLTLNKKTAQELDGILKDRKEGKNMTGPFDSFDDFIESLDS